MGVITSDFTGTSLSKHSRQGFGDNDDHGMCRRMFPLWILNGVTYWH